MLRVRLVRLLIALKFTTTDLLTYSISLSKKKFSTFFVRGLTLEADDILHVYLNTYPFAND